MNEQIKRIAARLEARYDPENDIAPGVPDVTWSDKQLLEMILVLADAVEQLKVIINYLSGENHERHYGR